MTRPRAALQRITRRRRRALVLLALATMIVKLRIAATTEGTNDVFHWRDFAAAVGRLGPVGVYATRFRTPYNHPPLIGWMLVAVNAIASHGVAVRFLVRVPATLADLIAVVLVFEILRTRRGLTQATVAGAVVALSPVLVVISGFHGNTDSLLVLFIISSAYLLADRDLPLFAGAAAALAVGVKLVPIVALPVLLCAAWPDRRRLTQLTTGFLVVFLPLWLPPVVSQWSGFKTNVLDYNGTNPKHTQWGVVDLARHLHSPRAVDLLVGPGRFAVLLISAVVPAALVLRSRRELATAVSLSLALFLLLTPTFGTQYLVWAAVPTLLIDVWWGAAYNAVAGALLVKTYTRWSGGFPWNRAIASGLSPREELLAAVVWGLLFICCVLGIRRLARPSQSSGAVLASSTPSDRDATQEHATVR